MLELNAILCVFFIYLLVFNVQLLAFKIVSVMLVFVVTIVQKSGCATRCFTPSALPVLRLVSAFTLFILSGSH